MTDQKQSKKSVKCSIIYGIKTKKESFSISDNAITGYLEYNSLNRDDATHVVVGIKWGANVVASFEYSNHENNTTREIEGALQATMYKALDSI